MRRGRRHRDRSMLIDWLRLYTVVSTVVAAALGVTSCSGSLITDEQRILSALMHNYLPSTPPTMNQSRPIVVEVSFRLNQIIDLDERNQILTTNVFIEQKWNDTKLSWGSEAASKDTKLRISAEKVWLPDTYVFNNADSRKSGFLRSVYVLLQPDGQVSWPVPDKLRTTCQVNIANFPFDYQKCSIRLGSWVHNSRQLVFQPRIMDGIDEMDYTDNSEWQLLSAKPFVRTRRLSIAGHLPKRLDSAGDRDTEPNRDFSDLVIELVIRRRSFFYVWNIILPCVMLSVLTLFTFRVPPDNCEKISMGLSVFLAFSMFMLLVAEQVPATSESVPLIGLYITVLMSMTTVSVIFSVCIVNLNHRGSKFRPPPPLLKKLFVDWLGRLLRVAESVEKAARQFEVADILAYRKTTDEYQHRMSGIRSQIAFFRDCIRLQRLEAELNAACRPMAEQRNDPLTRWLSPTTTPRQQNPLQSSSHCSTSITPARIPRLRRFETACSQLPYLDSGSEDAATPLASPLPAMLSTPVATVVEEANYDSSPDPSAGGGSYRQTNDNNDKIQLTQLSRVVTEWKLIALVIDTLFFYLFLFGTIFVYVYLFFIFPSINLQNQAL